MQSSKNGKVFDGVKQSLSALMGPETKIQA